MSPTTQQLIEEAVERLERFFCTETKCTGDCNKIGGWQLVKPIFLQELSTIASKSAEIERKKHGLKKCLFCKRKYRTEKGIQVHQAKCFKNPNRVCTMCDGDGLVDEVMNNGYMGHKNHPCYDCETAKKALSQKESQ